MPAKKKPKVSAKKTIALLTKYPKLKQIIAMISKKMTSRVFPTDARCFFFADTL